MLEISEQFNNFFKEFDISINQINEAYINPSESESIGNIHSIYLKRFENQNEKRQNLLILVEKTSLCFATWFPSNLLVEYKSPINVLESFATEFGFPIKCKGVKGYFIKNVTLLTPSANPDTFIVSLRPASISIMTFRCLLYNSNKDVNSQNNVRITFAFEINRNKLLSWVHSPVTIKLKIKTEFKDLYQNIIDGLHPNGTTGVELYKQINPGKLDKFSNEYTDIEIPKIYKNMLTHVANTINELKRDETIVYKYKKPIKYGCIFCRSKDLSDEHIFPKWLRPYIKDYSFTTRITKPGDLLNLKATTNNKKELVHGFTDNSVCVDCNTSWMKEKEEQANTLLISQNKLVSSISTNISKEESKILSSWLILKSLLLLEKNYDLHVIPSSILSDFKKGIISNNFIVEAYNAKTGIFNFKISLGPNHDRMVRIGKLPYKQTRNLANNLFICCLQFGHLIFRVSYLDDKFPLTRATTLAKTITLFPFDKKIPHLPENNEAIKWNFIRTNYDEFHAFADHGFIICS